MTIHVRKTQERRSLAWIVAVLRQAFRVILRSFRSPILNGRFVILVVGPLGTAARVAAGRSPKVWRQGSITAM